MTDDILLRDVTENDLPIFFEHQQDQDANYMAAFTAKDPTDKEIFMARWVRILSDDTNTVKAILFDGHMVGSISSYVESGKTEVTYWIGREYWGRGIATRALSEFLRFVTVRPLYARAAKDNIASLRVLEKCGFAIIGEDKGFSNARGVEVEEFVLQLKADNGDEAQRSPYNT